MCNPVIDKLGATPAHVQWVVVRGDSASLRVDFLEADEVTHFDTTGWTYKATSYDPTGEVLDELQVVSENGYAIINAQASITAFWGQNYKTVVAELPFDLQVRIPGVGNERPTIWTPVIGTICVLGDVTPGGSL